MSKIGIMMCAAFFLTACNNSADNTTTTDSAARKDNTNVYDTGVGSSMADTSHKMDTSNLTNKMQDTGSKK